MPTNLREKPHEDFQKYNAELQEKMKVDTLLHCRLFRGLSVDDIRGLSAHAAVVHYKKGTSIFEEGNPADFFYVVQDGLVKVYKGTSTGKILTFTVAGRGDTLNATAVSGDNYYMSAQTLNEVTVLKIGRKPYHAFLTEHSSIAIELIGMLSSRLNRECDRVVRLLGEDVEQRLIISLFTLARKFGTNSVVNTRRACKLRRYNDRNGYQGAESSQETGYHRLYRRERRDNRLRYGQAA